MKLIYITLIIGLCFTTSCKQGSNDIANVPFKDLQVSRILILNTFSSTDSAIKAVAYFNDDIGSISEDRGGGSSGEYFLKRHRGWSIHLKEGISKQSREKLIEFLKSLEDPYRTIESVDYGDDCDSFEYKYTVTEESLIINVKAEAEYTKHEAGKKQ